MEFTGLRRVVLLSTLFAANCAAQVDVVYTRKLLGWMRFPEMQSPDFKECDPNPPNMTGAAKDFYAALGKNRNPNSLILGMGDKFAPYLEARTFNGFPALAPAGQQLAHTPKDLFAWNGTAWTPDAGVSGAGATIPADNVGCFLRAAGYDAIVPGSLDFYYGPERLRAMAKFLYDAKPHQGQAMHQTAVVAANLAVITTVPEALPRIPTYEIEHNFEAENRIRKARKEPTFGIWFRAHGAEPALKVNLPDIAMPWLRDFPVDNALELVDANGARVNPKDLPSGSDFWTAPNGGAPVSGLMKATTVYAGKEKNLVPRTALTLRPRIDKVLLCPNPGNTAAANDPNAFARPGSKSCTELAETTEVKEKRLGFASVTFSIQGEEILKPDSGWALCLHQTKPPAGEPEYLCQPFYVAQPFFQDQRGDVKGHVDNPYAIVTKGGVSTAVFGLVDPALLSSVGRLNYGYLNQKRANETSIAVGGLSDALGQAWMRCKQDPVCGAKTTRKVLLAQMPAIKASQFVSSLNKELIFDLVIAQPDKDHETGNADLTRRSVDDGQPGLVVTPGEIYSDGDPRSISLRVQHATVTRSDKDWILCNTSSGDAWPQSVPAERTGVPGPGTLRAAAAAALQKLNPPGLDLSTWSTAQILQRLALTVMQRKHHADVSMLQSRDLFEPRHYGFEPVTPQNLQEVLDRVFPKGDLAFRIPVTGATLAAVMTASDAFAAQDEDPLNTDPQTGRGVASLGLFKEKANDNWIVNGALVDPAKLYSITLSDYMALGDTGYSALQTPAVPPALGMQDFKDLDPISALVCRAIRDTHAVPNATCFNDILTPTRTLDISSLRPADETPGFTAARRYLAYVSFPLRNHRFGGPYDGQNDSQTRSHQLPYWSFELEKGDFGVNVNVHRTFAPNALIAQNGQAQALANAFSGVQVSAVTAPNSVAFSYDSRTRLKRSMEKLDFFVLEDISYSYTRTQDSSDDHYSKALTANNAAVESGLSWHLRPLLFTNARRQHSGRQLLQYDLLTSLRFETQPLSPRQTLTLPGNPSDTTFCTQQGLMPAQTPGTGNCMLPVCVGPNQTGCVNVGVPSGSISGTLSRSRNLYAKLGMRLADTRSWLEGGLIAGQSIRTPYQIRFNNPQGSTAYLDPGQCSPAANAQSGDPCYPVPLGRYPAPQKGDTHLADWIQYLSTNHLIDSSTTFSGIYRNLPQYGAFLNFSLNIPLPVGDNWSKLAGKGISLLEENTGQYFFHNHAALAAETQYSDTLASSLVIPVLGNLSLKPEIDLIFYRAQVANIPFHSVQYMMNLSYTFAWRQGQPIGRALRYASPAPSSAIPSSGR